MFKEARFYRQLSDKKVHCVLCPHSCFIENGERGKCKARQNINGKLKSLNYAKPHIASSSLIEQNSIYHVTPGKESLNISALGNNLNCTIYPGNIKEYDEKTPTLTQTPAQVISQAEKINGGIISYIGEPITYYEYMEDIASKNKNMKQIMSTNGFISEESMLKISQMIKGVVFEIKSMNDEFYQKFCGARLEPILKAIKMAYEHNIWIELKITMGPHMADNFYEIRKLVSWMFNNLNSNIPLHIIAYCENDRTKTSPEIMLEIVKKARKMAIDAGLNFVYTDNVNWKEGKTTFCPNCKRPVIIRENNSIENFMKEGKCVCGTNIPGIWK